MKKNIYDISSLVLLMSSYICSNKEVSKPEKGNFFSRRFGKTAKLNKEREAEEYKAELEKEQITNKQKIESQREEENELRQQENKKRIAEEHAKLLKSRELREAAEEREEAIINQEIANYQQLVNAAQTNSNIDDDDTIAHGIAQSIYNRIEKDLANEDYSNGIDKCAYYANHLPFNTKVFNKLAQEFDAVLKKAQSDCNTRHEQELQDRGFFSAPFSTQNPFTLKLEGGNLRSFERKQPSQTQPQPKPAYNDYSPEDYNNPNSPYYM